jgi:putative ABC transport system permease protein
MTGYALSTLWSHRTRTVLTLLSVAVCAFAVLSVDGMLEHMRHELANDVDRYTGKLTLEQPGAGYPPFGSSFRQETVGGVLERPEVSKKKSTPLLLLVLVSAENPMDRAKIMGVGLLPGHERAYLDGSGTVAGSSTLSGQGSDAVLVGKTAAGYYDVDQVGERLVVRGRNWRVAGLLRQTSAPNIDTAVFFPLASAQRAFGAQGLISALMLTPARSEQAGPLERRLRVAYPSLAVVSEQGMRRDANRTLEMPNKFMGMISWTVLVATAVLLTNITVIGVRERRREIGVIRAIGGQRSAVLLSVLVESVLLAIVGGAAGVLAAIPAAHLLGWAWILNWAESIKVLGLLLGAACLAALYPAMRAASVDPVRALRYE